jgi:hypothetical protein
VSKTPFTAPSAFKRSPSLKTTLAYMGSNMSLLAKGEETGGRFALMQFHSRPGNEPPPHIHQWERMNCTTCSTAEWNFIATMKF